MSILEALRLPSLSSAPMAVGTTRGAPPIPSLKIVLAGKTRTHHPRPTVMLSTPLVGTKNPFIFASSDGLRLRPDFAKEAVRVTILFDPL